MSLPPRHNVFISYYHDDDQRYKDRFIGIMGSHIVDKSVNLGDIIDDNRPTEAVLQRIREDYIAQVSVTVVLIGRCTWQRKYVDWEIGASLRDTTANPRCGLLGILLPNHPDFGRGPVQFSVNTSQVGGQLRWRQSFRVYLRLVGGCDRDTGLDS